METRHIKVDYSDALSAKKNALSLEIDLLTIAKKLREYNLLRKKEIALKNKLRINLISLKARINIMQSMLPKQEYKIKEEKAKKRKEEIKENLGIQEQLEEIQDKLRRLK